MEKTGADLTRRRVENWLARLDESMHRADNSPGPVVEGILKRVVGMTMEATGCQAPVGGRCHVVAPDGNRFEAEVVGFAGEKLFLMPTGDMRGMVPNARIVPAQRVDQMHVGPDLLGRVVDGAGKPLDDLGPLSCDESIRLAGTTINPLARQPIREPLDVGIRAINSLLTVGRGQRIGLFAGSGVGKSRLLGMMTRFTDADVTVVGLIGERGREVKEFVEDVLGKEGMQKSVVVATPADHPPLMRMHGAWLATAIAEYFRDQGKKVLL
ncbi:MAG: flagellum-specific ATP synthase FliI, partial [Gammaproteobacteria bacterium]|nr:flagellum-specific ATP synthase FliI [Gammaproteobacteria bacterium]